MAGFDPKAAPEELAILVVGLPDGVNFAAGEVGALVDVLLIGKPEERDPTKYAEVFRLAVAKATSPWMSFACRAEEVNGRRRAKGADMPALADKLDRIAFEANEALPNTPEKFGLMGNVFYNIALVGRGLRRYREAAYAQFESASWYGLSGDHDKHLVGIFAGQVEEVTAAFVAGEDEAIARSIRALIAARDHTANAVSPYPDWMQKNAAVHIAWALMMEHLSGGAIVGAESLDRQAADFANGCMSSMAQWKRVFECWEAYCLGEFGRLAAQTPVDLPSSSLDNAALTVQILRALAEKNLGEVAKAEERLRAVAAHSGTDGGIPIAVAKRILATL